MKFLTLIQIEKRKWLFLVGLVALTHLFCQSLMLPYGNALVSLLHTEKNNVLESSDGSSVKTLIVHNNRSSLDSESLLVRRVKSTKSYNVGSDDKGSMQKDKREEKNPALDSDGMDDDDDFDFVEDESLVNVKADGEEGFTVQNDRSQENGAPSQIVEGESSKNVPLSNPSTGVVLPLVVPPAKVLLIESAVWQNSESEVSTSVGSDLGVPLNKFKEISKVEDHLFLRNNVSASTNASTLPNKPVKKKMRCDMPPKTVTPINEMQQLLVRHRARSRAMVCHLLYMK